MLYGTLDVELCPNELVAQRPLHAALAARLPREATWVVSPLSRTARTADAIFAAGYPRSELTIVPGLTEQDLGDWQGLPHGHVAGLLSQPPHAFWPINAGEQPPHGESFPHVIRRVGAAIEHLAAVYPDRDIVAVSHGGAIRAAVAHALRIGAENALHLSVGNLSLTRIDREPEGWRVVCVNEMLGC
jgi:broad specificity phosphatase PhoE